MLRVVVVLAAVLLATAACFFKPDFSNPSDAAAGDGKIWLDAPGSGTNAVDAFAGNCTGPDDDMSVMPMNCGGWGTVDVAGSASLIRTSGVLNAMVGSFGAHAECFTTNPVDFSRGVSIEVPQVINTTFGDATRFIVSFGGGGSATISAYVSNVGLQVVASCSGPGGFSSAAAHGPAYRHFKFAILNAPSTTVAAYHSEDGQTWTSMGSCSLAGSELTVATVRFGATAGSAFAQRIAKFDNFRTCETVP